VYFYVKQGLKVTIGDSIRKLLESGNQVILPGFGNLKMQESGKGSAPSGSHLDPPGAHIRFDSSYSKDDGNLATFWARESGGDPEEARQRVLELIDAIRFALDKGETYMLPGAGEFRRDDDGKVHFSPEKGWLLHPDQYGLESMDLLELEEEPPAEEEAKEEKKAPEEAPKPAPEKPKPAPEKPKPAPETPKPAPEKPKETPPAPPPPPPRKPLERKPPPPTAPAQPKPWERDHGGNDHRRTRFWRIIWAVAGLLILVLAVLLFVPKEKLPFLGGQKEVPELPVSQDPAPVDPPSAEEPQQGPRANEGQEAAQEEAGTPAAEQVNDPPQADPEVLPDPPRADRFFLIAGSFQKLINASELQDRLRAKGYEAEVISTENRMYRVSIASFKDKRSAEHELHRIKQAPGMESIWLLVNE